VAAWIAGWHADAVAVTASLVDDDDHAGNGFSWHGVDGVAAIGFEHDLADLGAVLASLPPSDDPLARHIGSEATTALIERLSGAAIAHPGNPLGAPSLALLESRRGAVGIDVIAGPVVMRVLVGHSRVDTLAPSPVYPRPALSSRRSVVDGLTRRVGVELDLGELRLGDARQLRVGDVLVTGTLLIAMARLFAGEKVLPEIGVRLGRHGTYRAVAVENLTSVEHSS
jgi:hypothetical protein